MTVHTSVSPGEFRRRRTEGLGQSAPMGEPGDEVSIWQYTNGGIRDHATGTVTEKQFVWGSSGYVSAGPPQLATGTPGEPYAAVR